MADYLFDRVYHHYQPRIGWLPFALLLSALALVLAAVLEVGWVPEDSVVVPAGLVGYVLALWLAGQRIRTGTAWAVLLTAGIALTVVLLARPWPPVDIFLQGSPAMADYAEQALALFADQVGGWARAVTDGGSSTETLAFAWGLALASWFLGAFLAWTSGRTGRPILGLTALGMALALTAYLGRAGVYWIVAFVGLATVAVAVAQYGMMEANWERSGTDYSDEVRAELLVYAGAASLLLMSIAFALPAINVRAIAESFRRQPAVSEAEETLSRVFAGVAQPALPIEDVVPRGQVGVLPRAFLLGSPPELLEDIVLSAQLTTPPGLANPPPGFHWRATSYDVYTGRGWLRSPEREQPLDAGEAIPLPDASPMAATLEQTNTVADPARTTFYTVGRILSVNRPAVSYWRGVDDLVRVRDIAPTISTYTAVSRIALPDEAALRSVRLDDVPPALLARYTQLPDDFPPRVAALAREVAGLAGSPTTQAPASPAAVAPTPYDQARALETFLRQYPYSLDVGLPPPAVDMVDYFLFDLQTGFCDYYATAMVMMARSLGLPARLAIGFLPQPPDDDGRQVLRQIDSHSWAEVYFPGHGWIEFEPTAPIPGQAFAAETIAPPTAQPTGAPADLPPVAMPIRAPQRTIPWPLLAAVGLVVAIVIVGWLRRWRWQHARPPGLDALQTAYYDLQLESARLGYAPRESQTPDEFVSGLTDRLHALEPAIETDVLTARLRHLGDLYGRRQYDAPDRRPSAKQTADVIALWPSLRAQLRRLNSPWRALRPRQSR